MLRIFRLSRSVRWWGCLRCVASSRFIWISPLSHSLLYMFYVSHALYIVRIFSALCQIGIGATLFLDNIFAPLSFARRQLHEADRSMLSFFQYHYPYYFLFSISFFSVITYYGTCRTCISCSDT